MMRWTVKDHEKFIAFCLLGAALMTLALMIWVKPVPQDSVAMQMLNMIVGAMIGAFGAAVQTLLKVNSPGDNNVKVDNLPSEPIPTAPAANQTATPAEELPDYAR